MFTNSEKKIIRKIRKFTYYAYEIYNFWFIYDIDGSAISWEGGYELSKTAGFRNEYSLSPGRYKRIIKTPVN